LRKHVPVMTVLRKERALTPSQWQRLQHDDEAHKLELGKGSERLYDRKKDKLQTAIDQSSTKRSVKSPRLGVEGCCGRGCNGCTIFWYDDKYQKARDLLAQNKQGKLLTKQQARQEIIQAAE
ncbi:MAG TPA: peptidase U32, partial [Rhizobiales bacterium]|nr:peptidase U32 [Hyphomicrobiales bacterium]